MATNVGTENNLQDLVQNLLHLEHDAIAAYDSTIQKLNDPAAKQQVTAFRADHQAHVDELTTIAHRIGVEAPREGDIKQMLTTGKVALAQLGGDDSILQAMKTNEDDTVQAYDQAARNDQADVAMRSFFQTALADEQRHRAWMETQAQT